MYSKNHSRSNQSEPHSRLRKISLPLLVTLTLLAQRLAAGLPNDSWVWQANDTARAIAFMVLSAWAVSIIEWENLRNKCIAAAVFGYAVADVICCLVWYVFEIGGYRINLAIQAASFISFASIYWLRSYDQPSSEITDRGLYCLRRKPRGIQDFFISLAGCFSSYGGYAICIEKTVFTFRKGSLKSYPLSRFDVSKYHVSKGRSGRKSDLEGYIGMKWSYTTNCMTLLRNYWNENK